MIWLKKERFRASPRLTSSTHISSLVPLSSPVTLLTCPLSCGLQAAQTRTWLPAPENTSGAPDGVWRQATHPVWLPCLVLSSRPVPEFCLPSCPAGACGLLNSAGQTRSTCGLQGRPAFLLGTFFPTTVSSIFSRRGERRLGCKMFLGDQDL